MKIICQCGYSENYKTRIAVLKAGWYASPYWTCPRCVLLNHLKKALDELHTMDCLYKDLRNILKIYRRLGRRNECHCCGFIEPVYKTPEDYYC